MQAGEFKDRLIIQKCMQYTYCFNKKLHTCRCILQILKWVSPLQDTATTIWIFLLNLVNHGVPYSLWCIITLIRGASGLCVFVYFVRYHCRWGSINNKWRTGRKPTHSGQLSFSSSLQLNFCSSNFFYFFKYTTQNVYTTQTQLLVVN